MIDQFDEFAEDFLSEKSERILIIVCSSKLDDLLFLVLEKFLLPKIGGGKDDLLEGDQPLSTFSSRIKMVYRLGIIDLSYYKMLEQLRAIRNKSAHNIKIDLSKSPFKDHVNNIKAEIQTRKSYSLTKQRYFNNSLENTHKELQCLLLTLCVILQGLYNKVMLVEEIELTVKISRN